MKFGKMARLIWQSIRRNKRDLALSSIGIVVGIGSLLLFTALGTGIKTVVLEEIFVVRQLEVVPKSVGTLGTLLGRGGQGLTDETVETIRGIDGVEEAYPKMKLTFPSSVRGGKSLLGKNLVAEMVADGIPPELIDEKLAGDVEFKDWEAQTSCQEKADCAPGHRCANGTCVGFACTPDDGNEACPGPSVCNRQTHACQMPIPVVANPRMLEIYNGSLHTALSGASGMVSRLPKLSEGMLMGFQVDALFGKGYLGESARGNPEWRKMRLVGFSDKAIDMGATMPIGYVQRLNKRFGGSSAGKTYHSIVVETTNNEAVPRVAKAITDELDLAVSEDYENAQRAGLLIMVITLVFNLISLIILAISAVNIMHTFLMILLERRREIGLMRALGATKGDIRLMVLGESTLVGLIGGLLGLAAGWGAIVGIDYLFRTQVGDFPFKPDSLFVIEPWMLAGAVGVAVFFCWVGALWPALRASAIDPAEALTGR